MNRKLNVAIIATVAIGAAACSKHFESKSQLPQVTIANETAVILRLTTLAQAELGYNAQSGSYASLDELVRLGFLNDQAHARLNGYKLELQLKEGGFQATAVPEKYPITGRRSFYVDENRIVRGADRSGAPATASDPAV